MTVLKFIGTANDSVNEAMHTILPIILWRYNRSEGCMPLIEREKRSQFLKESCRRHMKLKRTFKLIFVTDRLITERLSFKPQILPYFVQI